MVQLLGGRREPVVLDVGAFQGDYGLMARQMLGPAAVIHCFEPGASRTTIREKAAGADLNVHCVALGAASGQATLFQDPAIPTMASLHPRALAALDLTPTVSEPVSVTTLDEFCASQGLERVDLLKIDTEGTELDVLRGASRLIANRAIEVIQFEFGYGNVATRTFMRDFYELLGPTHAFYRVAPRGMIALGPYDLALEVFVGATNYAAVARDGTSISATSGVSGAPRSR